MATHTKCTFVFGHMNGCTHCNQFYGRPGEDSVWNQLLADKELSALGVSFSKVNFGKQTATSPAIPTPQEYAGLFTYGPYLFLQAPGRDSKGAVVGETYVGARSHDLIAAWIKTNLATNPKYRGAMEPPKQILSPLPPSSSMPTSTSASRAIKTADEKLTEVAIKQTQEKPRKKHSHSHLVAATPRAPSSSAPSKPYTKTVVVSQPKEESKTPKFTFKGTKGTTTIKKASNV